DRALVEDVAGVDPLVDAVDRVAGLGAAEIDRPDYALRARIFGEQFAVEIDEALQRHGEDARGDIGIADRNAEVGGILRQGRDRRVAIDAWHGDDRDAVRLRHFARIGLHVVAEPFAD